MFVNTKYAILILAVLGLVLSTGCSSSGPKAQSAPPIDREPAPTPAPQPSVSEEVISDQPSQPVVSEQPMIEELPQDLVILNARGYLNDIFFETDSYQLEREAREHLASNVNWLRQYPSVRILIEGHCDERNTREYNLALGQRRAAAVRDYLVFLGLAADRVQTISYGEEKPFSIGHNEGSWRLNRRAHFVITAR